MTTNPDFKDLLSALNDEGADFLIVGAHAVMFFTTPRYTKDLDIWVRPSPENAVRVYNALASFGAPLAELTIEDLSIDGTIFQIGIAPNRIDVLTTIEGVRFEDAWARKVPSSYGGVPISILGFDDLVANKTAVARPQDMLDLELLKRSR